MIFKLPNSYFKQFSTSLDCENHKQLYCGHSGFSSKALDLHEVKPTYQSEFGP